MDRIFKYWMVHVPDGGHPPNKLHASRAEAEAEAKRLSRAQIGRKAVVMEAVSAFKVIQPEPTELEVKDPSSENGNDIQAPPKGPAVESLRTPGPVDVDEPF